MAQASIGRAWSAAGVMHAEQMKKAIERDELRCDRGGAIQMHAKPDRAVSERPVDDVQPQQSFAIVDRDMLIACIIDGDDVALTGNVQRAVSTRAGGYPQHAGIDVRRPDDPRAIEGAVGPFGESATPNDWRTPPTTPSEGSWTRQRRQRNSRRLAAGFPTPMPDDLRRAGPDKCATTAGDPSRDVVEVDDLSRPIKRAYKTG